MCFDHMIFLCRQVDAAGHSITAQERKAVWPGQFCDMTQLSATVATGTCHQCDYCLTCTLPYMEQLINATKYLLLKVRGVNIDSRSQGTLVHVNLQVW